MPHEQIQEIELCKPQRLPSPLPEPDSDSSVEEIDLGIHDHLYGQIEDAWHTKSKKLKIQSTREQANPRGEVLERLNEQIVDVIANNDEPIFIENVLLRLKKKQ